ncbi:MAG: 23S rRNA (guanosine(2251)-2'-O)-methyltransferase RlmB [Acidimicrobiia bacterium]|nr:23S rRNA (guanosine(2251)-2'-O)-methyltransferase RlmB [Acidimicrobiia bacterium]
MAPTGYGGRVEGLSAVEAALEAGRVDRLQVIKRSASSSRLADLLDLARDMGVAIDRRATLEGIAVTSSHQGVIADCRLLRPVTLSRLVSESTPASLVVVDHVTDPRNLGAIARSAVAAGTPRLVIPRRRGSPLTPTAFKAAAGALERARVCLVSSIPEAIRRLSQMDVWSVGLTAEAPDSLFGLPLLSAPVALVVGAEHRGLSRLVMDRVDQLAAIPMAPEAESLNASVAAGLALFELARMRGSFDKPTRE